MKKKTIIILIFSLVAAVVVAAVVFSPKTEEVEIEIPKIELNKVLNNSMSEIEELKGLDKKVNKYLKQWHIKGASLAIMRNDSLLYAKGYGWADEELSEEMEPSHILRMASVSKLITAAGIMVLQDRDSLSIKDTVFGPSGILNDSIITSFIKDKKCHDITVEHLLRHQGGFSRDPLFSSRDVMKQLKLDHSPTKEDFYKVVLNRRLRFKPGSSQKYSNFGYLLLSEVIEKVSGQPYEQFIIENVLEPAGCYDLHIADIYYDERRENEVRYYTHEGDGQYIEEHNRRGSMVERSYGGTNLPVLSGAGAWCGSTAELARFVAAIDGDPGVPDIISAEALAQMTEYFDKDTYSLGWNDTDPDKGWSRTGTLAGTTALVKYFPDGECWIMITNSSTWKGPRQANYTNTLFKNCRKEFSSLLPKRNLFEEQPSKADEQV